MREFEGSGYELGQVGASRVSIRIILVCYDTDGSACCPRERGQQCFTPAVFWQNPTPERGARQHQPSIMP